MKKISNKNLLQYVIYSLSRIPSHPVNIHSNPILEFILQLWMYDVMAYHIKTLYNK